ncbi:DUF3618 domain-containing protein [Glaciihabitans tibetensis]|uniref:DUF3618 domain-containing protein n=1 Tax=Glaciihabitans tibetensis TaxID=1266600 RepID=UPI0015E6F156|nr:DUF3618 domain-containing protein [Glaciihabitans tibetensis]
MNAIRLDAERARADLDKTLSEIERRLDPQRIVRPVKKTAQRSFAAVRAQYTKDPVRLILVSVIAVGTIAAVLIRTGRGSARQQTQAQTRAHTPAHTWAPTLAAPPEPAKPAKPAKPAPRTKPAKASHDPLVKAAKKTSRKARRAVKRAHK